MEDITNAWSQFALGITNVVKKNAHLGLVSDLRSDFWFVLVCNVKSPPFFLILDDAVSKAFRVLKQHRLEQLATDCFFCTLYAPYEICICQPFNPSLNVAFFVLLPRQ